MKSELKILRIAKNILLANASMNSIKIGISHSLFLALKLGSCFFLRHYASPNLHMNLPWICFVLSYRGTQTMN